MANNIVRPVKLVKCRWIILGNVQIQLLHFSFKKFFFKQTFFNFFNFPFKIIHQRKWKIVLFLRLRNRCRNYRVAALRIGLYIGTVVNNLPREFTSNFRSILVIKSFPPRVTFDKSLSFAFSECCVPRYTHLRVRIDDNGIYNEAHKQWVKLLFPSRSLFVVGNAQWRYKGCSADNGTLWGS